MAGAAEVHEKLDEGLAKFSKFAGEFVNAGLPVGVAFAAQKAGAALGEREKDSLESGREALGFLFGINAGACGSHERQCRPKDLRCFFVAESAGELFEIGDAIRAIEQHVNGQAYAHMVGKFFEAGAELTG